MAGDNEGSVTAWIASLKAGDADAAQALWRRYFAELVRLARDKLRGAPKAVADEEDAALNAFDSFVRGAAGGRYPLLHDRDELWRLLVVITERKALNQAHRERRQKRGSGRVIGMDDPEGIDAQRGGLACIAGGMPTPEFAALVADECRHLLGRLRDDSLRQVAWLRMEGYTNEEIADRLKCSVRSVARRLELIRRTWQAENEARS